MFTKRLFAAALPVAALALAFGPTAASADDSGAIVLVRPNVSIVQGVEVAGVNTGSVVYSCAFDLSAAPQQACVLPTGEPPAMPVTTAAAIGADGVAVAGVQAGPSGQPQFTCTFNLSADGPQNCVIGS